MHWLDWAIVAAYLIYIVYDGLRLTKKSNEVEGYFLANRSLPWWAVGLSVMATQMSAITLVGTTGQAYADGMRFIQFYFGLPIALIMTFYTMFGGVQAVTWTDVKQMIVVFTGLFIVLIVIISKFPAGVSVGEALNLAGAVGRVKTVDTSFDPNQNYT